MANIITLDIMPVKRKMKKQRTRWNSGKYYV